jgi:ComF family protein
MLLVPTCVLCGRSGVVVCPGCEAELDRAPSLPRPLELDACVAVFDYRGARHLVTALKNGDRRDLVGWLAGHMAVRVAPPPGAMVTWAPTGHARRRARGYDQAELLARALARRWSVPCRVLLRRRAGPPQSGRSAGERQANPAFHVVGRVVPAVVVVDDVVTTGATLSAAARALRSAGATRVEAVVGARAAARRAA